MRAYCECGKRCMRNQERDNYCCDACYRRFVNASVAAHKLPKPKWVAVFKLREMLRACVND